MSLILLGDRAVAIGDYVRVHVGCALQTIAAVDAQATWARFDDISVMLCPTDA